MSQIISIKECFVYDENLDGSDLLNDEIPFHRFVKAKHLGATHTNVWIDHEDGWPYVRNMTTQAIVKVKYPEPPTPEQIAANPDIKDTSKNRTGYRQFKYQNLFLKERTTVETHRIVGLTLLKFEKPTWLRAHIWDMMNEDERFTLAQLYSINHKDHDKLNNHPSNLEFVTPRGNSLAYIEMLANQQ